MHSHRMLKNSRLWDVIVGSASQDIFSSSYNLRDYYTIHRSPICYAKLIWFPSWNEVLKLHFNIIINLHLFPKTVSFFQDIPLALAHQLTPSSWSWISPVPYIFLCYSYFLLFLLESRKSLKRYVSLRFPIHIESILCSLNERSAILKVATYTLKLNA
jgi:hypothetical protein